MWLGMLAILAILVTRKPATMVAQAGILLMVMIALGTAGHWVRSLKLIGPTAAIVFLITLISFDLQTASLLTLRLVCLLTVSLVAFGAVTPEEMGDGLRKLGVPYGFSFILTTSMRYVPLMGLKIRRIYDAQRSRGIDLRPKLGNLGNFRALLMPLLVQSFILSDGLALAMESRGFGRKDRSCRREYRMAVLDYGLLAASLAAFLVFFWWERGP
jgi:energy-coupling factor transport system permease protein